MNNDEVLPEDIPEIDEITLDLFECEDLLGNYYEQNDKENRHE